MFTVFAGNTSEKCDRETLDETCARLVTLGALSIHDGERFILVDGKAEEARPLMQSWSFLGPYGVPECYAVRIWTTSRVLWVSQYDGRTRLDEAPRSPTPIIPSMPGGG